MVLVGPSGCGKTTSLRMLAGLERVSSGAIYIGERDVTQLAPKQRDIAMVFQNYALYPHMTVAENMGFALKMAGVSKKEITAKVTEAAELLGLDEMLKRKPRALSGGQRQRVAMGRAIVREPHVFLMDEPLSNLDAKLRVQTRSQIAALQRRLGVTTVYVTHDQTEAMTMGDRVAVLKDGVLQQVDTPRAMYSKPDNAFVAAFIGSPQMNLFDAEIIWTPPNRRTPGRRRTRHTVRRHRRRRHNHHLGGAPRRPPPWRPRRPFGDPGRSNRRRRARRRCLCARPHQRIRHRRLANRRPLRWAPSPHQGRAHPHRHRPQATHTFSTTTGERI